MLAITRAALSEGDQRIPNWIAPPYWAPPVVAAPAVPGPGDTGSREPDARRSLGAGPVALPFTALFPCRLVDTRGNAPLTGGFLTAATVRSYTLTGVCNVPPGAQAISLNATVVKPTGPGFLTLYPEGGAFPPVSTLNYVGGDVVVNAAVVELSPSGGISMALGVSGGDVILDTNGYYAPEAVVTSLNTKTGSVSLVAGSNITITPGTSTLTIGTVPLASSVNGQTGPVTISGTNGISAVTSSGAVTVTSNATSSNTPSTIASRDAGGGIAAQTLSVGGNLLLPATGGGGASGVVMAGGQRLLHGFGSHDTFLGVNAGNLALTGGDHTAMGYGALGALTAGSSNSGFGSGALAANDAGSYNSAFGTQALNANTAGNQNVAFGVQALATNTTGSTNSAFGTNALIFNTTGSNNVAAGWHALYSNTTGVNNAAVGSEALLSNTTGASNDAFGFAALASNTTACCSAAFGEHALTSSTAPDNSAFGVDALLSDTIGSANAAFGRGALRSATTGSLNVAVGYFAGWNVTTGSTNVAVGAQALALSASGGANTAIGSAALARLGSGDENVAVGNVAAQFLTSGSFNIVLGGFAGETLTSGSNEILIGSDSQSAAESNVTRIGSVQTAAFIAGISGKTSAAGINVLINSSGQLGTTTSSRRFKDDIVDIGTESSVLTKLRPVAFFYKPEYDETHTRQYGLVAEEVAEVAPGLVVFDAQGRPETVRYHLVNAMLLNEVQKQRREIDALRLRLDSLLRRLEDAEALPSSAGVRAAHSPATLSSAP